MGFQNGISYMFLIFASDDSPSLYSDNLKFIYLLDLFSAFHSELKMEYKYMLLSIPIFLHKNSEVGWSDGNWLVQNHPGTFFTMDGLDSIPIP